MAKKKASSEKTTPQKAVSKKIVEFYKLKKDKIVELIKDLGKEYNVFTPHTSNGIISYAQADGEEFFIPTYTHKSAKEIFFPQREELLLYEKDKCDSIEYKDKPIAILGIKPCDAKSINIFDKIFTTDYKDPYWESRRKNSLLFVFVCNKPKNTCFCHWLGIGPFNETNADFLILDTDAYFIVKPTTEKAKKIVTENKLFEKATDKDIKVWEKAKKEAESLLSEYIDISGLHKKLPNLWDNKLWDKFHTKCIACGACTYLCPTCHCFDIQDEENKRIRIWDSCMFPLFTKHASGHNPRPTTKERLRQRIMHKFNYLVENLGIYGCVGCGRCIQVCPTNVDIREIIKNAIQE